MKLVVLFPYHYRADNFKDVFLGIPPKSMGRAPTALKLFLETNGYLLIGGGNAWVPILEGGSERERESLLEFEILNESIFENGPFRLGQFSYFKGSRLGHLRYCFKYRVGERILIDVDTGRNTETVAQWVRSVFDGLGVGEADNHIFVVADYNCLRAWTETVKSFRDLIPKVQVIFVPSAIPYAGELGDVGIVEAPILQQSGAKEDFAGFIAKYRDGADIATAGRIAI